MKRLILATFAFAALLLLTPHPAHASELEAKMKALAVKVAALVKEKEPKTVALGEFTGPPANAVNSGAGLQLLFAAELARQQVKTDDNSALIIKGEYLGVDGSDDEDALVLRLVLTVRDKKANRVGEFSEDLPVGKPGVNEEIAKALGIQAELGKHKKASDEDINKKLKLDSKKPPLYLDDFKIKTTNASPFAVEVLVRRKGEKEFKPVKPTDRDDKGRAFVALKAGDVYRLRLHNASRIESVATVTIDGVDACQFFHPADERPSSFLVRKESSREVKGWLRGTGKMTEFLVGSFGDSAAAKVLKSSAKLGTITVCFHHCWEGDKVPDEYKGSRSANRLGTGEGDEIKVASKIVKRTIGPLLTSIVIRYDR